MLATEDKRKSNFFCVPLVILLFFVSEMSVANVTAKNTFNFNIPQKRADLALTLLAEQANLTLVFPYSKVKEKVANRLVGEYPIEDAVKVLLQNTGLKPTFSDKQVLNIDLDEEEIGNNMKIKRSLLATVIGFVVGGGSLTTITPVNAQENKPALQLEEVIVTARKREENLQKTPISITAITSTTIEDAHLANLSSIENLTPNLNIRVANGGSSSNVQAFIRGVGEVDDLVTTDPGVGIYIDGVYLARTPGSNLEFNDIERIEVLRGPQGTLFGKNTIGGALNVVTKKPSGESNFNIEATVGSYGHKGVSGYAETGLVDDTLSASLSFISKKSDGWQKRKYGADDAGNDDMWGLRAHMLWTPSDMFSSHLVVDHTDQDQQTHPRMMPEFNGSGLFAALMRIYVDPTCCTATTDIDKSNAGPDTRDDIETSGLSWTNEWQLSEMTLKSITGYREIETDLSKDGDNSPADLFATAQNLDQDQFSQEFTLSGTALDEKLDWTGGIYYFEETSEQRTDLTVAGGLYAALSALPLSVTTPFVPGVPAAFLAPGFDLTNRYDRKQDTKSYAAYIHTTYQMSDKARLTLAARYTREEKDLDMTIRKRASGLPTVAAGATAESTCSDVVNAAYSCSEEWSEFSPKIGVDYQFTDELMAYAHVSRGFRSGVFNGRPTSTANISTADPETLTSYEVGFKSQLSDNRVQLNGSLFYNDYKNQQFIVSRPDASGLALLVDNAGESNAWGGELELTALMSETITVNAGLSYIDPEYDEYFEVVSDGAGGFVKRDLTDRPFANVPKVNANLGLQYETNLDSGATLRARTDISYKSKIYYGNNRDALGFKLLQEDGYANVDAGITYVLPNSQWELSLYGKNLTDQRPLTGGFEVLNPFGISDVSYKAPRRYFFSVKYRTN